MGGLVIKRAYLLAKGKWEFEYLATRIQAMFFLATPHRGADLASTLLKLLSLGGGPRPFITDLQRNSSAIQSINDEFPHHCHDMQLCSFYETLPTSFGVKKSLVVDKDLAILGYANERREYIHANHRGICKYASQDDTNYRTVRNALASGLDILRNRLASSSRDIISDRQRLLETLLGVSDGPEDDLMNADSLRMSGSCEWLVDKSNFQEWLHGDNSPIYVIVAKPATGKTILCGKVITHLRKLQKKSSFYFFKYGNQEKSNITTFLLSMARQMALSDENVLATCLKICEKDDQLRKADYRTIWRKLFLDGILKVTFEHIHYWVIDALDECKSEAEVVPLLMKVAEVCSVRVFLTSRNSFEPRQRLGLSSVRVLSEPILEEDTKSDIALYLDANVDQIPSADDRGPQHIVRQIVDKSRGCFLWVTLVFQELKYVHTSADVERILDEVPTDMNELFARILHNMSKALYGKALAQAILTWTVCSTRPLKIVELSEALRYACDFFFEHIMHLSWTDKDVLFALAKFFNSSNVLSWVEYIAKYSDLHRLIQTSKALRIFLQGSSSQTLPLAKELVMLNSWATDLIRLVMKFGTNLKDYPHAIFHLIPPFCPPATAPWKQFASTARSINVRGLRAETWDDCLSTIVNTYEQYSSLASSTIQFAIGSFGGTISLFKQSTFEQTGSLQHGEPVGPLKFGNTENILVSAGSKSIRIWDLASKVQLWRFDVPQQCMALTLTHRDLFLLGATKDHRLKIWDLNNGDLKANVDWTRGLEEMRTQLYRRPVTAAFSIDADLLAIIYKGHDILLWDLESDSLYDIYSRESSAVSGSRRPYGSAGVRCLVFGNGANANVLISAYGDGELVLFHTSTGEIKNRVVAFANSLSCSPDGSTLATADPSGTIQLFNLETMHLIYRINSVEPGIQGLAFSGDSLHLIDIRGSRCRVWGPTVLVGQSEDEEASDIAIVSNTLQETSLVPSEDVVLITSLACHESGEVFFCGKEDGSVYVHNIESGLPSRQLFSHAHGVPIVYLFFEEKSHTLSSIDSSSRIKIHRLTRQLQSMVAIEILFDHRADMSVGQLVCEIGLNRILISSEKSDMLWSISLDESVLLATISYEDRGSYRWANHPSNPGHLILITHHEVHIFDWLALRRLTGPAGIRLEGSIPSDLSIYSIIPCFNGTIVATMFSEARWPPGKSKLVLWNASDFTLVSKAVTPSSGYSGLNDNVEVLIGTTGTDPGQTERLVFLDGRNWVCSADPKAENGNHLARHFFFPSDWLSRNLDLIFAVTKRGDIILVKRDEVVIVKRGLLTSHAAGI
ncbi:hypothetical protein PEX1_105150 [Penicillium expansum]|uniref:Uncharacterized protein n=1 Tax=Penicillium expansum TaxID=27334 RepID=A0A0A2I3F6_PENEN|nr:hypothetical protein PEX2_109350 [Penicillium expansum]KGO37644.1 hypothetical protein PEXP_081090 [Penicillium expansum]KGO45712.1 hypothetical protein PEX1_105150 [Penicillium expansum]KGO52283.1 hypothetical protein PEX2_109350 [Penicillium expansum]